MMLYINKPSIIIEKCVFYIYTCYYYVMCNIDDYLKARGKLRDAELTSNLESEMEAAGERPKRRKWYVKLNIQR